MNNLWVHYFQKIKYCYGTRNDFIKIMNLSFYVILYNIKYNVDINTVKD